MEWLGHGPRGWGSKIRVGRTPLDSQGHSSAPQVDGSFTVRPFRCPPLSLSEFSSFWFFFLSPTYHSLPMPVFILFFFLLPFCSFLFVILFSSPWLPQRWLHLVEVLTVYETERSRPFLCDFFLSDILSLSFSRSLPRSFFHRQFDILLIDDDDNNNNGKRNFHFFRIMSNTVRPTSHLMRFNRHTEPLVDSVTSRVRQER